MVRPNGIDGIKKCWKIIITQNGVTLHSKEYTTLKLASQELGLGYSHLVELGPNGRRDKNTTKKKNNYIFHQNIEVIKLIYENILIEPTPILE